MPSRRRPQKGTFAAHFDELVKHFPHEPAVKMGAGKGLKPPKPKVKTPACVNRALLDQRAY
jgi:hypothetical protein